MSWFIKRFSKIVVKFYLPLMVEIITVRQGFMFWSKNYIYSPPSPLSRHVVFWSVLCFFVLILPYFAFIFPFYVPFSLFLFPFSFTFSPLFFSSSKFFSLKWHRLIFPQGGRGIFQSIDSCRKTWLRSKTTSPSSKIWIRNHLGTS